MKQEKPGRLYQLSERAFKWLVDTYGRTLSVALRFAPITLAILVGTIALNVYLFIHVPKGFFPQQDNGRLSGSIQGDQDTSFQAMNRVLLQMVQIVKADPAVDNVLAFTAERTLNSTLMFIALKPPNQRDVTPYQILAL